MARLHEYQGKAILAANGFKIPRGRVASTADEAAAAAKELVSEVVVKIQAWTTGRAGIGGVAFAKKPEEVRAHTKRMLAMKVGQFHRQHSLSVRAYLFGFFGEGDSADPCASCSPGLDLNDNFADQFLRSRGSFVGSRCDPAARDFESIRRENS